MILNVLLSGGLGNQMFQYATAKSYADRIGAELRLDVTTGFHADKVYRREYELDVFPGPKSCQKRSGISPKAWVWLRVRGRPGRNLTAGMMGVMDERLDPKGPLGLSNRSTAPRLLSGYWQNELFFQNKKQMIKAELFPDRVKERLPEEVAVHVRKLQYTRGVGTDFFHSAISEMRNRLHSPRFALYTDDVTWGHQFASQFSDMEVAGDGGAAIDDFRSLCGFRHFVLSNSTFSWWAAWLAETDESHIICPDGSWWPNPDTPPARWLSE